MMETFFNFMFSLSWLANAALFIPQIILLLRKRHSDDVSLVSFIGFCCVQFFTVVHGYYINDQMLMLGVGLSLLTCGTTTILIAYYRLSRKGK